MIFSVDRSGSMIEHYVDGEKVREVERWYSVADFVTEMVLAGTFDINSHGTHLGLVSYANE